MKHLWLEVGLVTQRSVWLGLFVAAMTSAALAEEVAPEPPASAPVPNDSPVIAPTPANPSPVVPAATKTPLPANVPAVEVPLAARDNVTHYLTRERVQDLQERLRPSVQDIESRGGAGRYLWSQRKQPSSMLQLINPFAPSEYGSSRVTYYQVPASVAPGQPPLPRAFRDAETHEANGLFLRAGW